MYLCICNAINQKAVRRAAQDHGAKRPSEVYAAMGVEPCCGKCGPAIRDELRGIAPLSGAASR